MPTYEYVCRSCGTHVEVFQHFTDAPLTECGVCGGPLRKVFHPAGILFKGSGFYATDSRRGASRSTGDGSGKADERQAAKESPPKSPDATEAGKERSGGSTPAPAPNKEKSA
jgi:putative FmdB family regulatory protein